ncbi:hypothetical protein FRB93_006557 [Tulasnella sp. JGI-2019a]|nr:hypothetical protein FRB93_006557 [Tulasnella sp. JGI-2019a]
MALSNPTTRQSAITTSLGSRAITTALRIRFGALGQNGYIRSDGQLSSKKMQNMDYYNAKDPLGLHGTMPRRAISSSSTTTFALMLSVIQTHMPQPSLTIPPTLSMSRRPSVINSSR